MQYVVLVGRLRFEMLAVGQVDRDIRQRSG
jgi:hypothetical protein